jgi:putative glutamine amidotransferase
VLLTTDHRQPVEPDGASANAEGRVRPQRPEAWIGSAYVQAVRQAGGIPVLAPPGPTDVGALLQRVDAVVLTGGHFDIHPSHYGEAVTGRLDSVQPERTNLELELARQARRAGLPLLGICGGMQAMAVAAGGTLVQDVPKHPLDHEQPTDPTCAWHDVRVEPPAAQWLGTVVRANSTHHQAVALPGSDLIACGWAPDGTIEVICGTTARFELGLQWHPELLGDLAPYQALIASARR